jgi:hypothetical protein
MPGNLEGKNKEMATEQNRHDHPGKHSSDYEKLVRREPEGINEGQETTNNADPGSAYQGSIPADRSPRGGINTSNSTPTAGGATTGGRVGIGSPVDRGSVPDLAMNSSNTSNSIDPHAKSNIGGRNPGQPQTPMGERDARQPRDPICDPSADPMTSRTPDKVQQQKDQEKQDQNKDDSQKNKQHYTL